MTGRPLDAVLRPRSVAVVGASADPTKRGHQILVALRDAGYAGAVHPVNPRGGEILGLPVSPSVEALPEAPDLAVLCTPAATAPEVLTACADRGIPAAIILALGFRESGEVGAALEARVREVASTRGIRVVGPNTSGLLNLTTGLNLIGIPDVPRGRLALVVQSGNVLLEQTLRARAEGGEGFALCVGLGNMADVAWHDVLDDVREEEGVAAVLVYAEGFERGRAFVEAAARLTRVKPVVVLKGGRTGLGLDAARSHTGALASEPAVARAALRAAGVVEVTRSDALYAVGSALATQPAVEEGGLAILSDGGGHATLAMDALAALGAPLADPSSSTRDDLRALLGPAAAVGGCVDVAGATDRDPAVFAAALGLLLDDPAVGGVLMVGLFGGYALRFSRSLEPAEVEAAGALAERARTSGKALLVHSIYASAASRPLDVLREAGVPVLGSLETACRAAAALVERGHALRRPPPSELPPPRSGGVEILARAASDGRTALLEPEARELAARYGLAVVPADACSDARSSAAAAERLGGSVAVRLVSGTILHKTDAGGVRLNVRGPAAASAAFKVVVEAGRSWAARRDLDPDIRGVLVSPMLRPPAAELLVGVRRDPVFGPVLAVGFGGVTVEARPDVAFRLLPATRGQIMEALAELEGAPLLKGARGRPAPDLDAVASLALAAAACLMDNPELTDLEANPVFAYPDGCVAVDVRALRLPRPPGAAARP